MAPINFAPLLAPSITALPPAAQAGQSPFPALPAAAVLPGGEVAPASTQTGGALPDASAASLSDNASMRPDQAVMTRQLAWPVFDGSRLAAAWHSMVRTYGAQLATLLQQAASQQLSGAALLAGQVPSTQANAQQPPLQGHPDLWRFVTPGPGQQLGLRIVGGRDEQSPDRRRRARPAIRVELVLADGSRASIQLEPVPGGVVLELAAADPAAFEHLRESLPMLKQAVVHAGLKLLGTAVHYALAPATPPEDAPAAVAASLPAPLFRAMADLALLLAAPAQAPR